MNYIVLLICIFVVFVIVKVILKYATKQNKLDTIDWKELKEQLKLGQEGMKKSLTLNQMVSVDIKEGKTNLSTTDLAKLKKRNELAKTLLEKALKMGNEEIAIVEELEILMDPKVNGFEKAENAKSINVLKEKYKIIYNEQKKIGQELSLMIKQKW